MIVQTERLSAEANPSLRHQLLHLCSPKVVASLNVWLAPILTVHMDIASNHSLMKGDL